MTTVYIAAYYQDESGRSPATNLGAFRDFNTAKRVSEEKAGAYAASPTAVTLFDSREEFFKYDSGLVKQAALKKLNAEERRVLGLPDPD